MKNEALKSEQTSSNLTFAIWTALGNSFRQEMGIRSCLVPVRVLTQNKKGISAKAEGRHKQCWLFKERVAIPSDYP